MKTRLLIMSMGIVVAALSVPVLRAAPPPAQPSTAQSAVPSQASSKQFAKMEARMRVMQEQMYRLHEAKSPAERSKLLREHMHTMLEQMRAMRAMGGGLMCGRGMMGGGMMEGRAGGCGSMGAGMMGSGMMGGGNSAATPSERRQWMQDRLDMMQMMMEQMMGQMQAMGGHGMGTGSPRK